MTLRRKEPFFLLMTKAEERGPCVSSSLIRFFLSLYITHFSGSLESNVMWIHAYDTGSREGIVYL
jgi:hypothetical protein